MIEIGNIYGHGINDQQIERLQSLGFSFRPGVSWYAGSQKLRFIDFIEGPSLELIEVEDEKDYFDFLPVGMVPHCPGINLVLSKNATMGLKDFQDNFEDWGPYSLHVNYDGSDDPGKPGWNYLNFEVPVVRDTFIWLTEREEPQPERNLVTDHPNQANCVTGLVFDLEEEKLLDLARLVEADIVEGGFEIAGVRIISREAFECSKKIAGKKFPLIAVIVETESLRYFHDLEDVAEEILCSSKPSLYIPLNEMSWVLIITT
jgi:hypothetical protein